MSARRPEIFVSATSSDLRSCRQLVKEALLTLGCVPVEQSNFPPDYRSVREMLRARIAACDAVMHIAGECYGAEPRERDQQQPRRSYTQMEYDLARELRKPVYLFICGEDFPYDEHAPEEPEKQELQRAHRAALGVSETLRTRVRSRDELGQRVRELQTQVDRLSRDLAQTRTWLGRALWAGFAIALVLAATLWTLHRQGQDAVIREASIGRSIEALADKVNQISATNSGASKDELFQRALETVAADMNVDVAGLRSAIDTFVKRVRADPQANFIDRARADFAEQRFAEAAQNADRAADEMRRETDAAERDVAASAERARTARAKEREMRTLAGDAHLQNDRYADAQAMFSRAVALAPREREPETWAGLQLRLAHCAWRQAQQQAGTAVAGHIAAGEAACRGALTVFTRTQHPADWAITQKHLGNVLQLKAGASLGGAERGAFLAAAVDAYRAALEVHTPESNLEEWLYTQNNLALALYNQAFATSGPEQMRLLKESETVTSAALTHTTAEKTPRAWALLQTNFAQALASRALHVTGAAQAALQREAIAAFNAALTVYSRDTRPEDWGRVQNMLAGTLLAQAQTKTGTERVQALTAGADAFRAALQVYTREATPQLWANTMFNLGYAESLLADSGSPEKQRAWLDATIGRYRAALEVRTRDTFPQAWAFTHLNLGFVLQRRAYFTAGEERTGLQAAATASLRHALEIFTPENLPSQWGTTQLTLASLLQAQAEAAEPAARGPLVREGIACCRAALRVFTRENTPQYWGAAQIALAALLQAQAKLAADDERASLLAEAVAAARGGVDATPRDGPPGTWGYAMNTLAVVLRHQAELPAHPERSTIAEEAVNASRSVLAEFAALPGEIALATARGNLADALLTQSELLDGAAQQTALDEARQLYRAALQVITATASPDEHRRLAENLSRAEATAAQFP